MLAPRWAHEPLSGAGAALHGGRWNSQGVPALYMSSELMTAVAEYEQDLGIRPGTFCAYSVAVNRILDLRDQDVLVACGISPADRFCTWKAILLLRKLRPPGWDIADRLIAAGAAGILVPSAQGSGGTNLVLWHWNDAAGGSVEAFDPWADLPRSWRSG